MTQDGRVALVTGAASGIGHAVAAGLAAAGVRVVMLDRSDAVNVAAQGLASSGLDVLPLVCDLQDDGAIGAAIDEMSRRHGRCDILVNNAGIHPKKAGAIFPIEEIADAAWEQVVAINLTAPFKLCRGIVPLMKANHWGRVVNVGSRGGRTWGPYFAAHYAATKSGLLGLTRVVAGEGAPYGITANYVAPGRIETPLSSTSSAATLEKARADVPMGRLGTVDDVAEAVLYLVSEKAAYVTGAVIDVNGGTFMG